MKQNTAPLSNIQLLTLQWQAVFVFLMMSARRFARLEQAGVRGAEARAEEFELQVRCALVLLTQQIAEARAAEPAKAEDARALEPLQALCTALLMMAMVAAKMKAELADYSAAKPAWDGCLFPHVISSAGLASDGLPVPNIDSS